MYLLHANWKLKFFFKPAVYLVTEDPTQKNSDCGKQVGIYPYVQAENQLNKILSISTV